QLTPAERDLSAVPGCEEALADVVERLHYAERLGSDVSTDRRLSAALDIEPSELQSLRRPALHASGRPRPPPLGPAHAPRRAPPPARPTPPAGGRATSTCASVRRSSWPASGSRPTPPHDVTAPARPDDTSALHETPVFKPPSSDLSLRNPLTRRTRSG